MLEANRRRVQRLNGLEIWMFILGRTLIAFGAGVLLMRYFPTIAVPLAWPAIVIGVAAFLYASKGLLRDPPTAPTE